MLIVMRTTASAADLERVKQYLIDRDFDFHQSTGANRVIIGVIGDAATIDQTALRALPGVLEIFRIPAEE
jgi:DAHP synthase ferredoxin-like domain